MKTSTIYKIFGVITKIISSIIISYSYRSVFSFLNAEIHIFIDLAIFVVSYLLAEIFYRAAKLFYKPQFMNKDMMTLADWIDKHIGPKKTYEIVEKDEYGSRYSFELNVVTLTISFSMLFVTRLLLGVFGQLYPQGSVDLVLLTSAFGIYMTYLVFLSISYFILRHYHFSKTREEKSYGPLEFYLYGFVYLLIVSLFIVVVVLIIQYALQSVFILF